MFTQRKKYIFSSITQQSIPEDFACLHCIGDDRSLFLILEINSNDKSYYNALKVDIPRTRAEISMKERSLSPIKIDIDVINELKGSNFKYITSSLILSDHVHYFDEAIKNYNKSIEFLNEYGGRNNFVRELFREILETEVYDLYTRSLVTDNPLHHTVNFIINNIEEDQNISPEWKFCRLI